MRQASRDALRNFLVIGAAVPASRIETACPTSNLSGDGGSPGGRSPRPDACCRSDAFSTLVCHGARPESVYVSELLGPVVSRTNMARAEVSACTAGLAIDHLDTPRFVVGRPVDPRAPRMGGHRVRRVRPERHLPVRKPRAGAHRICVRQALGSDRSTPGRWRPLPDLKGRDDGG